MGETALELERLAHRLFDNLDRLDFDGISQLFADDVQGVDELARGWLRGRDALRDYFGMLQEMDVADMRSKVSDLTASVQGDVGWITLNLDQTYTVGDERQEVHAPTTLVARKDGGEWKLVLVHSVPLPEDS